MSRLVGFACFAGLVHAGLLPETIGAAKRTSVHPMVYGDVGLAAELGLDASEEGEFVVATLKAAKFLIAIWRLKDPTSAMTFFQASRDPAAVPSKIEKVSVTEPNGAIYFARGNYVIRWKGLAPTKADLDVLYSVLPRLDQSGLPTLPSYLPEGRLPNSDRYIIGPATLERFEGRISPGIAAFSMAAEGVVAKYAGDASLIIFNYPTPQIARERVEEFRKVPGSVVKRSGPLVAVVLGAADANVAEALLAKVNYQATLTWNEANPGADDKRGANMLLQAFTFAGILMLMCVGAGVAFGLIRVAHRGSGKGRDEPPMTRLGL